ncbi:phosphotransferase family protein [Halioglobus sp. Uisw_031]|uniref:phosphotransferase family protein n=1 Tax=Halioglobus sp. Uisw_031 TaxID=3230977 RepID=UPI0039E74A07
MKEALTGASDDKAMADCLWAALLGAEQTALVDGASIDGLARLSGGANMETWSFDWVRTTETEPLILRRVPGQTLDFENAVGELTLKDEAALIDIAGRYGVPVPVVRLVLRPEHALGQGYIMSRERGEALPFRLLADDCYRDARERLAFQCGQTLGRIHKIPLESLPEGLSDHSGVLLFQRAQELLDTHGNLSPVLQLGLNWLRDRPRRDPLRTLVHGDFRNGNLLVDEDGLVAVLDWELAHLGDPVQDLGYICANVWRFGSPKPVGGFGDYADLLAGYESVTGIAPAMADIHYWQVHAALSWGMVCLRMLEMYRSGEDSSLERAAVGRRLSEAEIDLLLLMEGESA